MTKEGLYRLKDLFFRIRQFYYGAGHDTIAGAGVDAGEAAEYVAALKDAERECFGGEDGIAAPDADAMLLYTVKEIRAAFAEKNYRLAGDLSSVGTRLCGVYGFPCLSRKRFWEKQVLPLREKHGDGFFSACEEEFLEGKNASLVLLPDFSGKRSAARYYDEDADAQMLEAHPVLYTLFAALGMLLFIGALLLYGFLLRTGTAWDILGYLGAGIFGVGLFSLPMAFIHQYMGHALTFSCLLLGSVLVALAVML